MSNWIPLLEAYNEGLITRSNGEKPSIYTLNRWCTSALAGDKRYFPLPDGTSGIKPAKRRGYLVHRDALPFTNQALDLQNRSREWITIKQAIKEGLITSAYQDDINPNIVTFWCSRALNGDKRYFPLPDGTSGVKQSKTGRKQILINRAALPFHKDFDSRGARFTEDDIARMKLLRESCSISQIAAQFGTSYNTIYTILERRGK